MVYDLSISPDKESERSRHRPWHPIVTLLHACIIFILIRALNDIPSGSDYLTHTKGFLLLEVLCTVLTTYLCVYLTTRWVRIVMLRQIPTWLEYGCPIAVVSFTVSLIILLSHNYEGSPVSLAILLPPLFVTVAMEILAYTWIKSSVTERKLHETQLNNERIINRQLHTEMKLLQLQFHPHFLFNMLNTIYFTIDDDNVEAKSTVEHLSNLLRGQLYSTDGKVPLAKEISTLNSYIYLACKRIDGQQMDIRLPDPDAAYDTYSDILIYPYLLLPVVENVFKHSGVGGRICITLSVEGGWLKLCTENPVNEEVCPEEDHHDHGIGLSNLTQRLSLIYSADDYVFQTERDKGIFRAKLCLKL